MQMCMSAMAGAANPVATATVIRRRSISLPHQCCRGSAGSVSGSARPADASLGQCLWAGWQCTPSYARCPISMHSPAEPTDDIGENGTEDRAGNAESKDDTAGALAKIGQAGDRRLHLPNALADRGQPLLDDGRPRAVGFKLGVDLFAIVAGLVVGPIIALLHIL